MSWCYYQHKAIRSHQTDRRRQQGRCRCPVATINTRPSAATKLIRLLLGCHYRSIAYMIKSGPMLWPIEMGAQTENKILMNWSSVCAGKLQDRQPDTCEVRLRNNYDDVIKWKHFPRYWQFVRGIHRWPVNYQHEGQWRGALMFSMTCAWINDWVNNRGAGDLRCHRAHYDVMVII